MMSRDPFDDSKEPFIQEIDSDDGDRNPHVEHPDDQTDGYNTNKCGVAHKVEDMKLTQNVSYRRVTYGGINGAYYTATTNRMTATDGMVLEESKQADKTTGQATHRVSRGINDKGHSLTRKLASDGRVDSMQTLHNLEEDELASFEQRWNSIADMHMPGCKSGYDFNSTATGTSNNLLKNWDTGYGDPFSGMRHDSSTQPRIQRGKPKKVVRINIE